MRTNRLTAKAVANARPLDDGRRRLLADGANLYLQATMGVDGTVRRSWVFRFEMDGRRREAGLGATHTLARKPGACGC